MLIQHKMGSLQKKYIQNQEVMSALTDSKCETVCDPNAAALKMQLLNEYEALEQRFKPFGIEYGTYNTPVNFAESLNTPIHRWYGYKEGFSPSFVREFIKKYSKTKDDVVFDPFGGVGTTALEANILGYNAYMMDVNPLGLFASKIKTHQYNKEDISRIKKEMSKLQQCKTVKICVSIDNETISRYFDPITWNSLLCLKSYIKMMDSSIAKELFSLSLLAIIEGISTHHKNGNGVKKKTAGKMPLPCNWDNLKQRLCEQLCTYLYDIESSSLTGNTSILVQSNLEPYTLKHPANIVLTSPPYANCFDYSKVYLTELWVGGFFQKKEDQKKFRDNSIISHVHYKWLPRNEIYGSMIVNDIIAPILSTKELWSNNIIPMLKGYFSDMGKFLVNLSHNLTDEATVGIVVGNSVYGGTPIATDLIIAKQAEEIGFECQEIKIYRKIIASSQQMILLTENEKHYVRESLIVLKWNRKRN